MCTPSLVIIDRWMVFYEYIRYEVKIKFSIIVQCHVLYAVLQKTVLHYFPFLFQSLTYKMVKLVSTLMYKVSILFRSL